MKKIFTLAIALSCAMISMAEEYKGRLAVIVNGTPMTQEANISVDEQGGTYTLSLKNFKLQMGEETMGIGNIVLNGIAPQKEGNKTILAFEKSITITDGDEPGVAFWMGPNLGEVPIKMTSTLENGALNTNIDIFMAALNQSINVLFTSATYQLPNSDFEAFHKITYSGQSSDIPDGWHSFIGEANVEKLKNNGFFGRIAANTVLANIHTFISDDVRPGSTGTKSVLLKPKAVVGVIANGTMTTGRMQAGSTTPTSTTNCAYLDMSKDEKDPQGKPFYLPLNAHPDALSIWVKFKKASPSEDPKATISANITDGTYFQDPQDKKYDNVMAKAQDKDIAASGEWKQLIIPFNYLNNEISPKAILMTISTNATPGKGNANDQLYIDDMELVYKAGLKSLSIKGQKVDLTKGTESDGVITCTCAMTQDQMNITPEEIVVEGAGQGTKIAKNILNDDKGKYVAINTFSSDLNKIVNYRINIVEKTTNAISNVETSNSTIVAIYNINGQQVKDMDAKGVYIVKTADGKVSKVIKK